MKKLNNAIVGFTLVAALPFAAFAAGNTNGYVVALAAAPTTNATSINSMSDGEVKKGRQGRRQDHHQTWPIG